MKYRGFTLLIILALIGQITAYADINVNISVKRPLPPAFSDWRNDPSIIQVVLTPNQDYSQVRIGFVINDLDRNKEVVHTKDNSPAMPRYNLPAGMPLLLTGQQLVREEALEIDPSIRTQAATTQMLPEGNYEFCVRLLDQSGNIIATSGLLCRQSFVTIPDPPELISPVDVELDRKDPLLPNFIWSPVANAPRGVIIRYVLKIAPVFKSQDTRMAIDNNTPLFNQALQAGRTSYQYMPSDIPFSRYPDATGFAWQVQALDAQNKPVTRNSGKSEIGLFTLKQGSIQATSLRLISPADKSKLTTSFPVFAWSSYGGAGMTSYRLKIAKVYEGEDDASSLNDPENIVFDKTLSDTSYHFRKGDPDLIAALKESGVTGLAWQVGASTKIIMRGIAAQAKSEPWELLPLVPGSGQTQKVMSLTLDMDCLIPPPTVTALSTKTYHKDDKVKIGQFELVFTQNPVASGELIKGEGYVSVPFLKNIRIAVDFSEGLKINTSDEVIEGSAEAKMLDGFPVVPNIGLDENEIKKYTGKAGDNGQKLGSLTDYALVYMPVGIDNIIKSSPFVLALTSARFSPNGSSADAAMVFRLPGLGLGADLCFGGRACINPTGFGDKKELFLVNDFVFPNNPGSWNFTFKKGDMVDKGTFVTFENGGFKEVNISATVEFPRSVIVPSPDDNGTVTFPFSTSFSSTKDLVAACTMPPFSPSCLKDFAVTVSQMSVDLASSANPSGMVFPQGFTGESTNNWQGFFIKQASIKFPDQFKLNTSEAVKALAENMIIDGSGFSSDLSVMNIANLDLGGFSASLDKFTAKILNSSFKSGGFAGKLMLPISDDKLDYTGTLTTDNTGKSAYSFSVTVDPNKGFNVPMWVATFTLQPTSVISISNTGGAFKAMASLNGNITISGKAGPVPLKLELMNFQNLVIDETGIKSGTFALGSPQKEVSGFPLSAGNIMLVSDLVNKRFGLKFDIDVNLYEDILSGGTSLTIWGKKSGSGYGFDKIETNDITINGDMMVAKVSGKASFFNGDAVYGDGFKGKLKATMMGTLTLETTLQFGSKSGYRYWYFDGNIYMSTGITVFTGVGIYGFGGGAYYHMKPQTTMAAPPSPGSAGSTGPANVYVPDKTTLGGIIAQVTLGLQPSSSTFNGDVRFEMNLVTNSEGKVGLGDIIISGKGFFIADIIDRSSPLATGYVSLSYNYPNQVFHGEVGANINVASIIEGGGTAVFHYEPSTWFIKLGEPEPDSKRIGVKLAQIFSVSGYLMIGKDLPGPASLPYEVTSVLGPMNDNRSPKIDKGDGFAFGGRWDVKIPPGGGKAYFLIFYAQFGAGMGFDVALLNYGKGTHCEGSDDPVGINGWYATGQLYAYLSGAIGLHVDVWFYEGDLEIASVSAAAALKAGLPNPTWGKGALGASYSVLGGLIRGHCNFEFSFGGECAIVQESPLARMDLIQDITPNNEAKDVSVFVEPAATFNFPIDKSFSIEEMPKNSGDIHGKIRTFRVKLDNAELKFKNQSTAITCNKKFYEDNYVLVFSPNSNLPGKKDYTITVTAKGEEYINNAWGDAKKLNGDIIKQTESRNFSTAEEPKAIPEENIAYTYPVKGQRFFIPNGSAPAHTGRILLKKAQDNLFAATSDLWKEYDQEIYDTKYLVRFLPASGSPLEVQADYHNNGGRGYVEFPVSSLSKNMVYNVQLVRRDTPKFMNNSKGIAYTKLTILHHGKSKGSAKDILVSDAADKIKNSGVLDNNYKNEYKKTKKVYKPGDPIGPDPVEMEVSTIEKAGQNAKVKKVAQNAMANVSGNKAPAIKEDNKTTVMSYSSHTATGDQKTKVTASQASKEKIVSQAALDAVKDNDSKPVAKKIGVNKDISDKIFEAISGGNVDTISTKEFNYENMVAVRPTDKILYTTFFRTSRYDDVDQKLKSINSATSFEFPESCNDCKPLHIRAIYGELFDEGEFKAKQYDIGSGGFSDIHYFGPFVQTSDDETNNSWFKNYARAEIYDALDSIGGECYMSDQTSNGVRILKTRPWANPEIRRNYIKQFKPIADITTKAKPYNTLTQALNDYATTPVAQQNECWMDYYSGWAGAKDFQILKDRIAANYKTISDYGKYLSGFSSQYGQSVDANYLSWSISKLSATTSKFYQNYLYKQYQPLSRGSYQYIIDIGKGRTNDNMDGVLEHMYGFNAKFNY